MLHAIYRSKINGNLLYERLPGRTPNNEPSAELLRRAPPNYEVVGVINIPVNVSTDNDMYHLAVCDILSYIENKDMPGLAIRIKEAIRCSTADAVAKARKIIFPPEEASLGSILAGAVAKKRIGLLRRCLNEAQDNLNTLDTFFK